MSERWRELFDQARIENGQKNVARAEELIAQAMEEAERLSPNTRSYASAQLSFALWEHHHERFAAAEAFQRRYIDSEKRLGISARELGNQLMWLAEMEFRQGRLEASTKTIEEAIETFPESCLSERAGAYRELFTAMIELGHTQLAEKYRKMSDDLKAEWDKQRGIR